MRRTATISGILNADSQASACPPKPAARSEISGLSTLHAEFFTYWQVYSQDPEFGNSGDIGGSGNLLASSRTVNPYTSSSDLESDLQICYSTEVMCE